MSKINVVTNETSPLEHVTYKSIEVDGLNIAYRETRDPANPKVVLLHGFPASSHDSLCLLILSVLRACGIGRFSRTL
jgi:pimeloyl-ACP methyl ester carboxylesterase